MKMEKIESLTSEDIVANNIAKLQALFPTAFSEGKLVVEELQALLGEYIEKEKEYYQMTWAGKTQAQQEANKVSTGTLRPCKEESKDWDTTCNVFIEGDNLEVLKLLQKSYSNKIKMIYIDPPYNTGKDFVYKDDYKDNLGNYLEITGQTDEEGKKLSSNTDSDGRYHSNWLNMMYPRLKLARNLLTDDGVIFISIDDNEQANLKKLCDEIFGEENFCGQWNWFKSATPPNLSKKIKKNIEYILCYHRGANNDYFKGIIKTSKSDDPFTKPQNATKELHFPIGSINVKSKKELLTRGVYGTDKYPNELLNDIIVENGTNSNVAIFKNKFIWTQEKLNEEIKKGTVINLSINGVLSYKKLEYGEEVPPNLIDENVNVDTTENAGRYLLRLFNNVKAFDYPKPVSLLRYLLNMLVKSNDIILDFFAGSGTTAHAVMALNAEDGGNRKCISVQLPEPIAEKSEAHNAGYKTIAEITKERIRRAGELLKKENQDKDGIDKLDVGFRVFKLDSSNIHPWDTSVDKLEDQLDLFEVNNGDHIKADRTEADVLFEILLKYGLELTQPIQEWNIADCSVYNIGFGAMYICLADQINIEVAKGIGDWHKEYEETEPAVIFKDAGFANDADKTNTVQTLRQFGIVNVKSI